jgi:hypothetical protein
MAGKLSVEWTHSARNQAGQIYQWSRKEADQFLDDIKAFEDVIESFPRSFVRSVKRKNHYLGLINKHVSAIYRIRKKLYLL